ncbi:dynein regulatory complex subunit 5 isoform X2 [Halyomorpha halys]
MQMPLLLEGRAKDYYKTLINLPAPVEDKMQVLLPVDVDIPRAIEVIEDGVFWKRLAQNKYPYMIPSAVIQKFSYKSLFIQEWFSQYLSDLEPYAVSYHKVEENTKMVAPYINILDIKELKAPVFRKQDPPRADCDPNLVDMPWLKETCLPPFPYVQRIDLSLILPHLYNLTHVSICFGFSNYERYRCFRKSRINVKDIENLFTGILRSKKIESLSIYMSAFYETDMRMTVRCLLLLPVLLTKLEISNCELDDRVGRMVGLLILHHLTIQEINLKRNYLTRTGAYFIAAALSATRLKSLKIINLSQNGIGDVGGIYMALMLTVNRSLQGLYLSGCRIGKTGALLILGALGLNCALQSMDLSVNHIGSLSDVEEERIVVDIKKHPKIAELTLGQCGLDPVLVEFIKALGNDKRVLKARDVESHGTVLVRRHQDDPFDHNWKAYSQPTMEQGSVLSTDSGELTSIGSTISDLEQSEDLVPRKKLNRFMKATLTPSLALKAIQSVLKWIQRVAIIRAQKTGRPIKSTFSEEIQSLQVKKLIKEELTRLIRWKLKKSKLFSMPEKMSLRTPIPRHVINNAIKIMLSRVPSKLVSKVINQTIKKVHV